MAFVPFSYSWPSLSNFQVQYQGTAASAVVMGGIGTQAFNIQPKGLEGLDLPATRNGDSDRPRQRGQFIGLDLFSGRDITITMDVGPPTGTLYSTLSAALAALRAVTNTADNGATEYPLFVQFPNMPLLATMARARKRTVNVDMTYSLGNMAQGVAVQWHSTDPFFYSTTQSNTVGLPGAGTGFSFPLSFPLSFGSGGGSSALSLTNAGDVECYSILTITGPCTYPTISNNSISGTPTIQFGVTMNSGDQLVVDMDLKTATYYTAGSSAGYSAMSTLQQGWSWWDLVPGTNQVQFASKDVSSVAGTLNVQWASAYSSAT